MLKCRQVFDVVVVPLVVFLWYLFFPYPPFLCLYNTPVQLINPRCGYQRLRKNLTPSTAWFYLTNYAVSSIVRQRRKIMDNDFRDKKYTFFQHKECEFFPCHKTNKPEDFNCLFCYCPLYALGNRCGGNFIYTESGFKDCTNCIFPHVRDNYPKILERYQDIIQVAQEQNK